jgi:AcrR family transcriptional regulator
LLSFIKRKKYVGLQNMDYFDEFEFKTPRQQRAKKALSDISESLEKLSKSGDLADLKSRGLSTHSGYAIGTIFHYFKKFDDVFVYIYLIRRRAALTSLGEIINNHPPQQNLSVLLNNVLNFFIDELLRPNRKTLLFVVSQFLKRTKNPQLINMEADVLIPLWMNASQRDKTGTIFSFSESEFRLRFRAMQSVVRSPFFEEDLIAGTDKHKELAFNIFMRLFTAPHLI